MEKPIPLTQYRRKGKGAVVAHLESERHFDLMLGGGALFEAVDQKGRNKVGVASWSAAVAAHRKGMRLQVMSSTAELTDDVSTLKGADKNRSTALERKTNFALARSPYFLRKYGNLDVLNDGRGITFYDAKGKSVFEADGVIVNTTTVLLNEAKSKLIKDDVHDDALVEALGSVMADRAATFKRIVNSPPYTYTCNPLEAMIECAGKDVVPVVSADDADPDAEAKCREHGVEMFVPRGEGGGFVCEPPEPPVEAPPASP